MTSKYDGRGWPNYILRGRVRTSTAALAVSFITLFWVHQTFQPAPEPPAPQVVPPGYLPDPDYTWVPRTNVREQPRTTTPTRTYRTTTPATTAPTDDGPTSPDEEPTTSPTSPAPSVPGQLTTSTVRPTTTSAPPPWLPTLPGMPK